MIKKLIQFAIINIVAFFPLFGYGQQYLLVDDLCLLSTKTYDDVYAIKAFANKRGYYSNSLQGTYADEFGNDISFIKIKNMVSVEYNVKTAPAMIQLYEDNLKATCRYWFTAENKALYHNTINGRFSLVLYKNASSWKFSVRENKKGDPVPAFEIEKNKIEINSYTDVSRIAIRAGDKVSLTTTGTIRLGVFAGNSGPDGINGLDMYSYNNSFKHGSLIGKIGENGNWFLIGSSKTFVADATGVLIVAVNDIDPSNNQGRYYMEYAISR